MKKNVVHFTKWEVIGKFCHSQKGQKDKVKGYFFKGVALTDYIMSSEASDASQAQS